MNHYYLYSSYFSATFKRCFLREKFSVFTTDASGKEKQAVLNSEDGAMLKHIENCILDTEYGNTKDIREIRIEWLDFLKQYIGPFFVLDTPYESGVNLPFDYTTRVARVALCLNDHLYNSLSSCKYEVKDDKGTHDVDTYEFRLTTACKCLVDYFF